MSPPSLVPLNSIHRPLYPNSTLLNFKTKLFIEGVSIRNRSLTRSPLDVVWEVLGSNPVQPRVNIPKQVQLITMHS